MKKTVIDALLRATYSFAIRLLCASPSGLCAALERELSDNCSTHTPKSNSPPIF